MNAKMISSTTVTTTQLVQTLFRATLAPVTKELDLLEEKLSKAVKI